jgi:hypothetical protein
MKKLLGVVAAVVVVVALLLWIASWFRNPEAVAVSAARPWPGGLGTLDSVAARFPPMQANDASVKLFALAGVLPRNQAVDDFVHREIARGDLMIGKPPALPEVSAMRELLLREQVVWPREGGIVAVGDPETSDRRGVLMTLARALVAAALAGARAGEGAAWENLQAVWNLSRSLEPHPEMMLQTASLSMARMVNAVAWKMPLPVPPWFEELQARDFVAPLLAAFQYQAASYQESGTELFPTKFLADSIERDRRIAEGLAGLTRCDATVPMNDLGVDLSSIWSRAFRYRAEREATANALRVRLGSPIETGSQCSDGGWTFDGTMLRFKVEIPAAERAMPLALRVSA